MFVVFLFIYSFVYCFCDQHVFNRPALNSDILVKEMCTKPCVNPPRKDQIWAWVGLAALRHHPLFFCWSLGASEHWEESTPVVTDRTYEELGFRQGEWGSWSAVLLIE